MGQCMVYLGECMRTLRKRVHPATVGWHVLQLPASPVAGVWLQSPTPADSLRGSSISCWEGVLWSPMIIHSSFQL